MKRERCNMLTTRKGDFGYLKKQPIRIGLFSLLIVIVSAIIFMYGFITKGDAKNLFTLFAVLGMLPAAKFLVSFILQVKAEKYSCPKELHENVVNVLGDSKIVVGYDFYLTSYKEDYPVPVCLIADGQIICLIKSNKNYVKELKEHLDKYLASNAINGFKVTVFEKESKLLERLEVLKKNEPVEADYKALALIKNLSL